GLVRVGGELPDRERRAVDRERRDHGVHTRAVGQTRVDVRRRLVHAAADLPDDLVDRPAELLLVVELRTGPVELPGSLHVDRVPVVDHDLRDLRVTDERLQRAEAEDAVTDLPDDEQLLLRGEGSLLIVEELTEALVDQALELGVRQGRVVQAWTQRLHQTLLNAPPDVRDPISLLCLREAICKRHGEMPPSILSSSRSGR